MAFIVKADDGLGDLKIHTEQIDPPTNSRPEITRGSPTRRVPVPPVVLVSVAVRQEDM